MDTNEIEIQQHELMDVDSEGNVGPVEVDDIELMLQQRLEQPAGKKIRVEGIIMACVQSALSKVKDKIEDSNRETERVKIVMHCLQTKKSGNKGRTFIEILSGI